MYQICSVRRMWRADNHIISSRHLKVWGLNGSSTCCAGSQWRRIHSLEAGRAVRTHSDELSIDLGT